MKTIKILRALTLVPSAICGLMLSGVASATVLTLPAANEMSVGVYNSFNIYSLDLLEQCAAANDIRCKPSGPYPVQSSPGLIKDQAVVLTSSEGYEGNIDSPFPTGTSVDDAFMTPTGQQSDTFEMTSLNEPGGTFTGDIAGRWDVSVSALNTYLNGHDLVMLFDNNQQGSFDGQNLAVWGQVRIVDSAGALVNNLCFEISTGAGGCADTGSDPAPLAASYLAVIGDFCVDKIDGISYALQGQGNNACPVDGNHASGGYHVTNNLGTSIAEFAAFNQALNDAVANAANANYFLSINVKFIGNLAGAEQLFFCSECDVSNRIPEPSTLALASLALLIVGFTGTRRRRFSFLSNKNRS